MPEQFFAVLCMVFIMLAGALKHSSILYGMAAYCALATICICLGH